MPAGMPAENQVFPLNKSKRPLYFLVISMEEDEAPQPKLVLRFKRRAGGEDPVDPQQRLLVETHTTDEHSLIKDVQIPTIVEITSEGSDEEQAHEKKKKKAANHRQSASSGTGFMSKKYNINS